MRTGKDLGLCINCRGRPILSNKAHKISNYHEFIKYSAELLIDDLVIENRDSLPIPLKDNLPEEVLEVLEHYENYRNDTLEGKHGKTAQYLAEYIQMIELYHIF